MKSYAIYLLLSAFEVAALPGRKVRDLAGQNRLGNNVDSHLWSLKKTHRQSKQIPTVEEQIEMWLKSTQTDDRILKIYAKLIKSQNKIHRHRYRHFRRKNKTRKQ